MPPRSKKARQAARTSNCATGPNIASGIPTPPLGENESWGDEEDLMSFQSSKKSESSLDTAPPLNPNEEDSVMDDPSSSPSSSDDSNMENISPIPLAQSNSTTSLLQQAGVDISGDEIANIAQVQQEAIDADESVLEPNQPVVLKKNLSVAFEGIADAEVEQKRLAPTPRASNEAIQVFLRIRPMSNSPSSDSTIRVMPADPSAAVSHPTRVRTYPPIGSFTEKQHRNSSDGTSTNPPNPPTLQEFTYSRVFDPSTDQPTLYQSAAAPLISSMFDEVPQSSLLFAYGITNAGKSHTIMGNESQPGVVPRAMKDIFERIDKCEGKAELFASYLEIYNEQVYDLLAEDPQPSRKGRVAPKRKALKLQDNHGTIIVKGLSKHKVTNTAEGLKLAALSKGRRQVSGTNLNGVSSRSHSVCQLELVRAEEGGKKKSAIFWIVDLAGSERSKRTGVGAKSSQQREASGINTSLMKLWRCLKQLRSNQMSKASAVAAGNTAPKAPIVPFRESKLTHLFMNHLAGSTAGKTVMIVNVNPQPADYDETQHVLNSATIAQSVKISNDEFVKKEKANVQTHDANGRNLKRIAEDEKAAKQQQNTRRPSDSRSMSNVAMNNKMHQMAAENTALREALNSLKERLTNAESEIREEVAEEFEEMVAEIHEQYAAQKLRTERMGVPTPARSVRKLQSERANEYVDELHDKIKECEEEMVRMNEKHMVELSERDATIESLERELAELKENGGVTEEIDAQTNVSSASCTTAGAINGADTAEKKMRIIDSDGTIKYSQVVDTPEGDETDSDDESVVDLVTDEAKDVSVTRPPPAPSVVAESKMEVKPEIFDEDDLEIVDGPGSDEKRKIDENNQAKKLRRLPRGRCSEVACAPVKKEKVEKKAEEATPQGSSQGDAGSSTVKRRGLLAKLTGTGKKKNKRGPTDENSGAGTNKKAALEDKGGKPSPSDRKSLGELSNVSELTQPTVMSMKSQKGGPYKRPRGRGPKGKVWNAHVGEWETVAA
ncbi:hypothetical protein TrST_g3119 [Triparma strigata]|uniref:Kinesin motor domain-containing protein n=1 Tax=Triparma strigata TaxID=1606541 RepID=A0A9W7C8V9_9STRA|nr:hypothetical protein TrST_g3119 [Triparma strigata]